jgi:vancomycin resistance protein YoaR
MDRVFGKDPRFEFAIILPPLPAPAYDNNWKITPGCLSDIITLIMTEAVRSRRHHKKRSPIEQVILALLLGLIIFLAGSLLFITAFQIFYLGRIYPGISISGIDIGGVSPSAAANKINDQVTFPQRGRILIYNEKLGQSWVLTPGELGLSFDPEATARSAFLNGRSGSPFHRLEEQMNILFSGVSLPLVLTFDQRTAYQLLSELAKGIDRPMVNAAVILNGTEVSTRPSQAGRQLDIPSTLALLSDQMKTMVDCAVPLMILEQAPLVADATPQAETARAILSQPLALTLPDGQPDKDLIGPWSFDPPTLAGLLSFEIVQTSSGAEYRVGLDETALNAELGSLSDSLRLASENTRFMFNDDTQHLEVIQPAVIGRDLNIGASMATIQQKLLQGEHTIALEFIFTPPKVTDEMTGEQLGIRQLIHAETSFFYGSSAPRVQNITAAAREFHGLLVAPGETFSMANVMGEISLDNGYAEALIIYGGRTIKGVGGGVCQVSTTLFRAAFFSGFPIEERYPHAYRVYYYEKIAGNRINTNLAGLDATVFVPVVDLKFTNDTPNWLLMETYVNPSYSSIEWKFYSTSDGRVVNWETTGPTNTIPAPKPEYRENSELPQGEVKQVDWEAEGAEVTVHRIVRRGEEILHEDTFYTKYEPWQAVYEYGPGTEGMPPPLDDTTSQPDS